MKNKMNIGDLVNVYINASREPVFRGIYLGPDPRYWDVYASKPKDRFVDLTGKEWHVTFREYETFPMNWYKVISNNKEQK
jgi:hypothetical protein